MSLIERMDGEVLKWGGIVHSYSSSFKATLVGGTAVLLWATLALFTTLTRTGTLNAPQSETFENHTLLPSVDSPPVRKPMGIGIRTIIIM